MPKSWRGRSDEWCGMRIFVDDPAAPEFYSETLGVSFNPDMPDRGAFGAPGNR